MTNRYTAAETLRLAKRANNPKRNYLLVNPLQGKHLPVSPRASLEMMQTLGTQLAEEFPDTALVAGFAETATAIGAMAASCFKRNDCVYIHTTREPLPEGSAVFFREEHSHAVEQALYCREMESWLACTNTVIFIDDELSTGRTLINIVEQLAGKFPAFRKKKLVAASILNRLTPENEARLEAAGIISRCLVKLPDTDYTRAAARFSVTGAVEPEAVPLEWQRIPVSFCNPRLGVLAFDYLDVCRRKAENLLPRFQEELNPAGKILVLGTEECMFPALVLGAVLEHKGGFSHIRCHATTRSPIGVSREEGYPIRDGWRLKSLYNENRETFIYNLERYDAVIAVSDGSGEAGLRSLSMALNSCAGNGCKLYFVGGGL